MQLKNMLYHAGQGHFDDEPRIIQVKGHIGDVLVKDIASSADCCLALSGECKNDHK
jgi:hypothetical protein